MRFSLPKEEYLGVFLISTRDDVTTSAAASVHSNLDGGDQL